MKRTLGLSIVVVLAIACAGAAYYYWTHGRYQQLPAFALSDLSGEVHHPSEWRGQVLVLNFWATWCKPCREEIPMLMQAQKELADQGVQIVGLAVDRREPVERFAKAFNINYPVLIPMAGVVRLQDALGGGPGLPFTVIVDRQGRIRARVAGRIDRERLNALLAPILKPEPGGNGGDLQRSGR